MPRIEVKQSVSLPSDVAFALSQTYGPLRLRWDPFIREQRLLDGAEHAGKGVRTWTRSRHGLVMISQYVTYSPPTHVGMKMLKGPWFFSSFSGGWNFRGLESGDTEATWRYNFVVKPQWLRFVADRIGTRMLRRDITRRLDAFRQACDDPSIVEEVRRTMRELPEA